VKSKYGKVFSKIYRSQQKSQCHNHCRPTYALVRAKHIASAIYCANPWIEYKNLVVIETSENTGHYYFWERNTYPLRKKLKRMDAKRFTVCTSGLECAGKQVSRDQGPLRKRHNVRC